MAKRKTEASLRSAHARAVAIRDNPAKHFGTRTKAARLAERLHAQLQAELGRLKVGLRAAKRGK